MYKFERKIDEVRSFDELNHGFVLWVWNPSQKSPHLGISLDGKYFSLKRTGKQEEVDIQVLSAHIKRKKNSVLFVELTSTLTLSYIKETFAKFTSCDADYCSCSKPIFELLDIRKENGILFDILNIQKDSIISLKGIGLDDCFEGVPDYTYDDVLINLNTVTV